MVDKMQPSLDDFIESLIQERNYQELLPEVREEMKKDISRRLVDTINAKAISALDEKDLNEFEALLKSNSSQQDIQAFMESHIADNVSFLTNVLSDFRKTYLGIA